MSRRTVHRRLRIEELEPRIAPAILVQTLTDLQNMKNNLAGSYLLANDIDASSTTSWNLGAGFEPIGSQSSPFTGRFDGGNHAITGLNINRPSQDYVGLFGYASNGSIITNVGLTGGSVSGGSYVGALVGELDGSLHGATVSYCYGTGSVVGTPAGLTGAVDVGGLVGNVSYAKVSNSYARGTVSSSCASDLGGLVGVNGGTVSDSYAAASVSGGNNSWDVGGLVGGNAGTLSNSYATGSVTTTASPPGSLSGGSEVGGLAGKNGETISNCYATGAVTTSMGSNAVGGLVGSNWSGQIFNSYERGSVTVGDYSSEFGGLVAPTSARFPMDMRPGA